MLQSQEGISIIPPSFQDHSPIWSNKALPEKKNSRLMCQYIQQGIILPASFSGKLLIGHPSKVDILSSGAKALETYSKVRMSHAKFGICKVINIGILCGTFQQESKQALSHKLESLMCMMEGRHHTPLAAIWDTVYVNDDSQTLTKAIFIKSKLKTPQ
jgi:hypothetical protein